MDRLIHIVHSEMMDWEEEVMHANRHSVFSEHILLANKIRQHQHIIASPTIHDTEALPSCLVRTQSDDQSTSVHDTTPATTAETHLIVLDDSHLPPPTPTTVLSTTPKFKTSAPSWTWLPAVPPRPVRTNQQPRKSPTFHRRSRQLFPSLDSTLAGVVSPPRSLPSSGHSATSSMSSTSPSLVISVTTEATSIVDEHFYDDREVSSFDLDLRDPRLSDSDLGEFSHHADDMPYIGSPRSFSRLRPRMASTKPMMWIRPATPLAGHINTDSAHKSLREFLKRLLPRRWARLRDQGQSVHPPVISSDDAVSLVDNDDSSVRHDRLSIASATQEAIDAVEAHGVGTTVVDEAESEIEALPQIVDHMTLTTYWSSTSVPVPRRKLQKAASTNSWVKLAGSGSTTEQDDIRLSQYSVY